MKYVMELPVLESDKICLTIPTTVAPRYVPGSDTTKAAKKIASLAFATESPACLSVQIHGEFRSSIGSVSSSSHSIASNLEKDSNGLTRVSVNLDANDLNRDIVVNFEQVLDEHCPNKPVVVMEKSPDPTVGMISMVPYFKLSKDVPIEAIFLID